MKRTLMLGAMAFVTLTLAGCTPPINVEVLREPQTAEDTLPDDVREFTGDLDPDSVRFLVEDDGTAFYLGMMADDTETPRSVCLVAAPTDKAEHGGMFCGGNGGNEFGGSAPSFNVKFVPDGLPEGREPEGFRRIHPNLFVAD